MTSEVPPYLQPVLEAISQLDPYCVTTQRVTTDSSYVSDVLRATRL